MTNDWKENPQHEDLESKLTLYVMGEADAATCSEVEQALREDESLRTRLEEMQRALDLLRAPQLQPVLGVARRDSLRAAAQQEQGEPQGKLLQFPVVRMAAALLIFGGMAALFTKPWEQGLAPEQSQAAAAPSDAEHRSVLLDEMGYSPDPAAPANEAADDARPSFGKNQDALRESLAFDRFGGDLGDVHNLQALGYVDGSGSSNGFLLEVPVVTEFQGPAGGGYGGPGDAIPTKPGTADLGARVLTVTNPKGGITIVPEGEELWRRAREGQASSTATPGFPVMPGSPAAPPVPSTGATPVVPPSAPAELSSGRGTYSTEEFEALAQAQRDQQQQVDRLKREADLDADSRFADKESKDQADSEENLRLRSFGYTSEDSDGSSAYADFIGPQAPLCVLTDGYGRVYRDADVLEHLRPVRKQETARDMFFRFYGDNPEVFAKVDPLSTFAADVDTASYPMARNYLVNNQLPPKASIRTEEFLNYFDYGMAAPTEDDFAVHLQASRSKFGDDGDLLLSIGIKAREVDAAQRAPMNLVFVIDKSGSMDGARIQLVKDALMLLVDQIRDTDTIGLVTFDSTGHVVLEPTPGRERYRIREAIRGLHTGGSTNAGEGIFLGYGLIEKVFDPEAINRVVLASDGVANTGETDQAQILKAVLARAEAKVDLTTLGVGMGNHNDVFLEQLADQGNGSCHYLDDLDEAKRVLVDGFLGTMVTVARDVKIQVEFDAEQVLRWRQLGYENRSLAHADFRNDAVDAGEVGSGHEVVALYEIQPSLNADGEGNFVTVRLRWKPEGSEEAVERAYQMDLGAAQGRFELASVRLRQMSVVAQYSEVLRRSWHARMDSYVTLTEEAQALAKELAGEAEVVELSRMIERTSELARWAPPQDELSMLLEEARRQRLLEAELAMLGNRKEAEDMLQEVRRQNQLLENRLQEMLQRD